MHKVHWRGCRDPKRRGEKSIRSELMILECGFSLTSYELAGFVMRVSECDLILDQRVYSAFRQKFPKLWTSVAHSFLQQIAQNKNWAHPKATTLPRICKVEMQQASLLYYSAKPQSGGILGCALVCPTSLYVRTIRFLTFCRSLPSVGAYSQYPAWSGCRRSADVPRADHDRVDSSPWQGGFKERVYCACLPSICLIFSTCKYMQPPLSTSSTKRPLMWPTFLDQKHFVIAFNDPKPAGYATPKTETTPLN